MGNHITKLAIGDARADLDSPVGVAPLLVIATWFGFQMPPTGLAQRSSISRRHPMRRYPPVVLPMHELRQCLPNELLLLPGP